MTKILTAPHGNKLRALLRNNRLPDSDKPRVLAAIDRYEAWIDQLSEMRATREKQIVRLVESLNQYKTSIDLELIFDSSENFLYRQRGQLKLDSSILEEFLPWLVSCEFEEHLTATDLYIGPGNSFAQMRFESSLLNTIQGGGMVVRSKDHDFILARPLFLKASHTEDFSEFKDTKTNLAYFATEIKTNLDKTMFQEASATAYDLKAAVPNSRYLLLCEWLDMTPISAAVTAMEEVIILRKAKRLSADVRQRFSTASGRSENRRLMERHLTDHPLAPVAFERFLLHVKRMLSDIGDEEHDVLGRGWF